MPYDNYQEYEAMMADEAKQAATEAAAEPTKSFSHRKVSGGTELFDPYLGPTFQSDYEPGD